MNPCRPLFFMVLIFCGAYLQGCLKDTCTRDVSYTLIEPVYVDLEETRSLEIVAELPRAIETPGKMLSYGQHIYLNERGKGIHIIENADPSNPVKTIFLAIPGNFNFVINNGILYANSYVDLLVFDLGGITDGPVIADHIFQPASRIPDVFHALWEDKANGKVAFKFETKLLTETSDCANFGGYLTNEDGKLVEIAEREFFTGNEFSMVNSIETDMGVEPKTTIVESSLAPFSILDNILYAVNKGSLEAFSLSNPTQPENLSNYDVKPNILKVANFQDKLMLSYDGEILIQNVAELNSVEPNLTITNATACDQIAFKNNLALVTKNSHSICETESNQLVITEVSSYFSVPSIYDSFPLQDPQGMCVHSDLLYLCDGVDGLKIFDITDTSTLPLNMVAHLTDLQAYDVLINDSMSDHIIVVGSDGIYQYSYSGLANAPASLISKIGFN